MIIWDWRYGFFFQICFVSSNLQISLISTLSSDYCTEDFESFQVTLINSNTFSGHDCISLIGLIGSFISGTDVLDSGPVGNGVVSYGNRPYIIEPYMAMDNLGASTGFYINLNKPAYEFAFRPIDQSTTINLQVCFGENNCGSLYQQAIVSTTVNPLRYVSTTPFNQVKFISRGSDGGWGFDDFSAANFVEVDCSNECDTHAFCIGVNNIYSCVCDTGYTGSGAIGECEDINACKNNPCDINADCNDYLPPALDTSNGRKCTCNLGYTGSGEVGTCNDIKSCQSYPCQPNAICEEIIGCPELPSACSPNSPQDRTCKCDTGYEPDMSNSELCVDIKSCENFKCDDNAQCNEIIGVEDNINGRTCRCNPPFLGTGEVGKCLKLVIIEESLLPVSGVTLEGQTLVLDSVNGGQKITFSFDFIDAPAHNNFFVEIQKVEYFSNLFDYIFTCQEWTPQLIDFSIASSPYQITCTVSPGVGAELQFQADICLKYQDVDPCQAPGKGTIVTVGGMIPGPSKSFKYPAPTLLRDTLQGYPPNVPAEKFSVMTALTRTTELLALEGTNFDNREELMQVYMGPPNDRKKFQCVFDETETVENMIVFVTSDSAEGSNLVFTVVAGGVEVVSEDSYSFPTVPVVNQTKGCPYNDNVHTGNCPTQGGTIITIFGSDFVNDEKLIVLVDGNLCGQLAVQVDGNQLTCSLPTGAGSLRSVIVSSLGKLSVPAQLVSYAPPVITEIRKGSSECIRVGPLELIDCDRQGGTQNLVVEGTNFGASQAIILIDMQECEESKHYPNFVHSLLKCKVKPNNYYKSLIQVAVYRGEISRALAFISSQQCEAGYYQDKYNKTFCFPCPDGHYTSHASNIEECTKCEVGKMASATGNSACQMCAPGYFQNSTGKSTCNPCVEGMYSNSDGKVECNECESGKYTNSTSSTRCRNCKIGSYQHSSGQQDCSTCPKGFFASSKGRVECTPCESGRYSNFTGSTMCNKCLPGSAQKESRQSNCSTCKPGEYAIDEGRASCLSCEPGRYISSYGATICTKCEKGKAQLEQQATSCNACRVGRYTDLSGLPSCLVCPVGRFSNKSNDNVICTPCPVGYHQNISGQSYCRACTPGKVSSLPGRPQCLECEVGKITVSNASSTCNECPEGKTQYKTGETICMECPVGKYNNVRGRANCLNCPPGQFQPSNFSSTCLSCLPGMFQPSHASSTYCNKCPKGKFSLGGERCEQCSERTVAFKEGSHVCLPCPDFTKSSNNIECICLKDYYAEYEGGDISCKRCPDGTLCDTDGVTLETMNIKKGFWRSNVTSTTVLYCIRESHCSGGNDGGICGPNREGLLCSSCRKGYAATDWATTCTKCNSISMEIGHSLIVLALLLGALIILFAAVLWSDRKLLVKAREDLIETENTKKGYATKPKRQTHQSTHSGIGALDQISHRKIKSIHDMDTNAFLLEMNNFLKIAEPPLRSSVFVYQMKILVGFFQVGTTLIAMSKVPWPPIFEKFMSWFSFFNFDFLPWQSMDCVYPINYLQKTVLMGLVPIAFTILLFIGSLPLMIIDRCDMSDDRSTVIRNKLLFSKFVKLMLFSLFLMYPHVSSIVLGIYNCKTINGEIYLMNDMSIKCLSPYWMKYALPNIVFVVLYPIGIPTFYAFLFHKVRRHMDRPHILYQLGFLYEATTRSRWYFELVDMIFKMSMTSLLVYATPILEMLFGIIGVGFYIIILLCWDPYVRNEDSRLHLTCLCVLMNICLAGYIMNTSRGRQFDAISDVVISTVLITLVVSVSVVFLASAIKNVKRMIWFSIRERKIKKLAKSESLSHTPSNRETLSTLNTRDSDMGTDGKDISLSGYNLDGSMSKNLH